MGKFQEQKVGELSEYFLKQIWEKSEPERSETMFEEWKQLRRKAQTDLFWLCQLLGYAVTVLAHLNICENFFIRKNPDIPLDELSVEQRDRLLFASRDSYKSSVANADFVQFIICWPDVKLAVQSSKIDRATPFIQEVKNFFLVREEPDGNLCLNTRFAILFPDHLLPERSRGADGEFTTPARKKFWKEPTCASLGIEESRASVHFHVLRSDDAVSESNSGPESREEAKANIGHKLIESRNLGDIRYFIGTPQNPSDGYALLKENLGDDLFVMMKSAWTVKDISAKKAEAALTETDYDLWFPFDSRGKAKLTFKVLKGFQRASPLRFASQQLCVSALVKPKIEITKAMVDGHVLPAGSEFVALNPTPTISVWDLAYIANAKADFSVGCAGSRDEFRGAIVRDVQRGRYTKPELISAMVSQAVQFRVNTIWIEGTNGAEFLRDDLTTALRLAGAVTTKIDFIPVENVLDAKAIRYESVYNALKENELWFGVDSTQVAALYELTRPRGKKFDDVADSLAHLLAKLKEPIDMRPKEAPASPALILLQEKKLQQLVYGTSDREWKGSEPTPAFGSYVEELKPEEPPKEWDGFPVFQNSEAYFHQVRS